MLTIRCCAPPSKNEGFKLPKRVARARRVAEAKRMETFREIHAALKKTAKDESDFVQAFFKLNDGDGQKRWWGDDELDAAADEEAADNEE
jgi:hypothetical protein